MPYTTYYAADAFDVMLDPPAARQIEWSRIHSLWQAQAQRALLALPAMRASAVELCRLVAPQDLNRLYLLCESEMPPEERGPPDWAGYAGSGLCWLERGVIGAAWKGPGATIVICDQNLRRDDPASDFIGLVLHEL